ncbi:MAG: acyltransferase family protein, partial [Acidobacteriaceae bacterium]
MTTFLDPMETSSAKSSGPSQRLVSLDALRGFDMFWIIGVDAMFATLHNMSGNKVIQFVAYQLAHSEWEGFRFYDLIFPLFVFIVGVSLVFSLSKAIEKDGRSKAIKRIFRRSLLLYALGVFYYGGFSNSWDHMRLVGVLPRIAFAYFFAGLLFCFFKPRTLVITCAGILIGYWALLSFVPFPNYRSNATAPQMVHGSFTQNLNLVGYFDLQYLPGDNGNGIDPEGLLSNIPAIASCLLGVFAGLLLKDKKTGDRRKVIYLLSFGVVSIALGWLWGLQFPVIKKLWTSSYVLVAGGYSAILLAAFYQIVDVWKY